MLTELGTYMKTLRIRGALQYTLGYTVLLAAENPGGYPACTLCALGKWDVKHGKKICPREKYETREKVLTRFCRKF